MRRKDGPVGDWSRAGSVTQGFRIADSVIRVMRQKYRISENIDDAVVFLVGLPEKVIRLLCKWGLCGHPSCCTPPSAGSDYSFPAERSSGWPSSGHCFGSRIA